MVLMFSVNLISLYFIGNLNDPDLLAGAGLGISLNNVIAFGVSLGFIDSGSAFMSQSYGSGMLE